MFQKPIAMAHVKPLAERIDDLVSPPHFGPDLDDDKEAQSISLPRRAMVKGNNEKASGRKLFST